MSLDVPGDRTLRTTFNQVADLYHGVRPPLPAGLLDELVALTGLARGLAGHDAFDAPVFRRWMQQTDYTTKTYFDLLRSFSGHIALAPDDRAALFACIEELLESRYGGHVTRATLTELCVARRRG